MADELLIGKGDIVQLSEVTPEIDALIAEINRIEVAIQNVKKNPINVGSLTGMKELREAANQLNQSIQQLNTTISGLSKVSSAKIFQDSTAAAKENTKATNEASSAYQKLQTETKQAEINAKNLAAQFGADSKEALEAAAAYDVLRQKLELVNSVTKKKPPTTEAFDPNSVPFTSNIDEANAGSIKATGEAVNKLEREQAEATNTATAFGNAQLQASAELETEAEAIPEIVLALDEYTGSISQNVKAQIENHLAIEKNRASQKQLQTLIESSSGNSDDLIQKLAQLKQEELLLVETNKNLSVTIRNQAKDFISVEGSIDEMRARLALLQKSYEQLSLVEKNSSFGLAIKKQIDALDPAVKKAEEGIGKAQRSVGSYSSSIVKAFSGTFSYLRQLAYIIPGLGMAGIIGLVSDAVVGLVEELFHFESAGEKAERQTKELTAALKEQGEAFGDFKDSVAVAVDKTIAKLKELGATQYEIQNTKLTGIGLNKENIEKTTKENIAAFNSYLNDLKETKDRYQNAIKNIDATDIGVGAVTNEINDFLKGPLSSIADIQISDADVKNLEKIRNISNQIINLETSKGFSKLTDTEKETFNQIKQLTSTILSNVKEVKTFSDQIEVQLAEQKADRIKAVRDATRERLESEIETTENINQRNKKALLDAVRFEQGVKAGNFDALRKQVIAERDFELSAENDKIKKINAIRNLELAKPENTEADVIRINAQADKEIASVRLTAKEREKIEKETQSKLFDINEAERKRNLDAEKQSFTQRKQLQVKLLNELSNNSEFGTDDRLKFLQASFDAQKAIIDKEHDTLLASKKYTFLTEEEKFQIQVDYDSKLIELSRSTQDKVVEILKSSLDKQLQLRVEGFENIDRLYKQLDINLSGQYSKELSDLNKSLSDKKISYEKYLKERTNLDFKYSQLSAKNVISEVQQKLNQLNGAQNSFIASQRNVDFLEGQLDGTNDPAKKKKISDALEVAKKQRDIAKKNYDDQLALEKQLSDEKKKLDDDVLNHDKENAARRLGVIAEILGQIGQLSNEIVNISDAISERRLNAIADEKDALEERYQREIDLINQTYVNAIDRDRELKEAEARHAAQKHQLDEREKQEKLKQAKFDKDAGIARIILNTAQAVVAALASVPPNVPLSIAAGVIGAAELAVAIATPLPRFFKGKNMDQFTRDYYEGYALINDGGKKEAIIREDGSVELPQKWNSVEYVGANDIVVPDVNMLAWKATKSAADMKYNVTVTNSGLSKEDYMYGVKLLRSELKNKPRQRQPDLSQQLTKAWVSSNRSFRDFFG